MSEHAIVVLKTRPLTRKKVAKRITAFLAKVEEDKAQAQAGLRPASRMLDAAVIAQLELVKKAMS